VGTVPFCMGLGICVRAAWRGRKSVQGVVPLALLASSLTVNLAGTDYELKWFWVILAYALASETYLRQRRPGSARIAAPRVPGGEAGFGLAAGAARLRPTPLPVRTGDLAEAGRGPEV